MHIGHHTSLSAEQRTSQHLMLLPQMQQALAILQVPLIELTSVLREALEANPLWEIDEPQDCRGALGNGAGNSYSEERVEAPRSVKNVVAEDIRQIFQRNEDCNWALRLLDELSPDGILEASSSEYADLLKCSEGDVNRIVTTCQQLDPPGIFAFSPQQALLLQMERLNRRSSIGYAILRDHYDSLIHLRLKELCRITHLEEPVLLAHLREDLRGLRRARLFEDPINFSLLVDASVRLELGQWRIEIHEENVPSLYMQNRYLEYLENPDTDPSVADFLEVRFKEGLFLKKALHQRCRTLRRILEAVLPLQEAFLCSSEGSPQELTMTQIAQQLSLSESTLSRAVSNKWLGTPRGLVSLRTLFAAPGAIQGDHVGVDLHATLRNLIAQETPGTPFSDEQLAEKMRANGFPMARRTVAKYRAALGIPGQKERRWRTP